jgi:hypothetical protein
MAEGVMNYLFRFPKRGSSLLVSPEFKKAGRF